MDYPKNTVCDSSWAQNTQTFTHSFAHPQTAMFLIEEPEILAFIKFTFVVKNNFSLKENVPN